MIFLFGQIYMWHCSPGFVCLKPHVPHVATGTGVKPATLDHALCGQPAIQTCISDAFEDRPVWILHTGCMTKYVSQCIAATEISGEEKTIAPVPASINHNWFIENVWTFISMGKQSHVPDGGFLKLGTPKVDELWWIFFGIFRGSPF